MDGCDPRTYLGLMAMDWLMWVLMVLGTIVAMEVVATLVHRHVMHGFGWAWHRSHHEPRRSRLEKNDLYAVVFSLLGTTLFIAANWWPTLVPIGIGLTAYGLLYFVLHDGLVHRRLPFFKAPRRGYVKRLVQAHRLHHVAKHRDGAVSYGFLYAPPIDRLIERLRWSREGS